MDSLPSDQIVADSYLRMPLDVLTTPRDGAICMMNRYWAVTSNDEALFYKSYTSPQCNHDRSIVEHVMKEPGIKIVFIPVAYIRHSCRDYV